MAVKSGADSRKPRAEASPLKLGGACGPGQLQGAEVGFQGGVTGPADAGYPVERDPVLEIVHAG